MVQIISIPLKKLPSFKIQTNIFFFKQQLGHFSNSNFKAYLTSHCFILISGFQWEVSTFINLSTPLFSIPKMSPINNEIMRLDQTEEKLACFAF